MIRSASTATKPPRARRPGVVRPDEVLTSDELKLRFGWGAHAFNRARASGLKCKRVGNTRFVFGSAFIEWLGEQPDEEVGPP